MALPEGLEEIGKGAFYYCTSLHAITIPQFVKKIGKEAFSLPTVDECGAPEHIGLQGSFR